MFFVGAIAWLTIVAWLSPYLAVQVRDDAIERNNRAAALDIAALIIAAGTI